MITYKCKACKVEHKVPPYDGSFVIYDGASYCTSCLILKRTSNRARIDKWSKEEAGEKIQSLISETQSRIQNRIILDQICEHVDQSYSPSFLPTSFFTRLSSIFDGSYKGLRQPIPAEHLLDMWEQKQKMLDKMAIKKWGTHQPEVMARINYDIAVLLGKYSSYLEWRKEKELEQIVEKEEQVSIPKTFTPIQNIDKDKDDDDIMSFVLADLFD